ncbi:MAG: hypothetical protein WCB12_22590 [Bryobacteraceae bacterium]
MTDSEIAAIVREQQRLQQEEDDACGKVLAKNTGTWSEADKALVKRQIAKALGQNTY